MLQCCAADSYRTLFSAAMSHSRLHQAAAVALRTVTAVVPRQHLADGVLLYLANHGQHVERLNLQGQPQGAVKPPWFAMLTPRDYLKVTLRQLPLASAAEKLAAQRVLPADAPG
jgi:hypothetical protein